ncbi:MAG: hypothetical protein RIQ71_262 [Verrucomicrobiota bacterium]
MFTILRAGAMCGFPLAAVAWAVEVLAVDSEVGGRLVVEAVSVEAAQPGVGKMKSRAFIDALADERVVDAVRAAEARTSGEIRVFITRRKLGGEDVRARGQTEFERLHVGNTALRNGVLFFVVPAEQTFAVIGDVGIHAKCGQSFWDETAAVMETLFREGKFTEGVLAGVQRAGEVLARHYPRQADDRNELSDRVARD